MANLAIKEHPKRGRKVIQLLEMLGGNNNYSRYCGHNIFTNTIYYIDYNDRNFIKMIENPSNISDFIVFTLEEFEEKFPYKVGDKVKAWINGYCSICNIQNMQWNSIVNEIMYKIQDYWYSTINLQPYKEESMEKDTNKAIFEGNAQSCDIMNDIIKEETMEDKGTLEQIDLTRELRIADEVEVILGDYEFVLKNGKTYFVKKKPQYPKTYEECCKILGVEDRENGYCGYEYELLGEFQKLYICRNAYWKIAGEQMGLGTPWNPDWRSVRPHKFGIYTYENQIKYITLYEDCMAYCKANELCKYDAFSENFKELIEQCKELL